MTVFSSRQDRSRGRRPLTRALMAAAIAGMPLTMAGAPAFAVAPAPPQTQAATTRPNILFILIDDMGFADLSVMGDRKVSTPNIDKLAHDGVLMTKFYDAAPICSASRAGFFTGRYPAEMGFFSFINDHAYNAKVGQVDWLDPKVPNLARMLHDAGYATGHFGKWHMGGGRDVGEAPWPKAYGFDEQLTTFEGLGPRVLVSDEERGLADQSAKLGQGPFFYEKKTFLTQLYAQKTLDFVSRHKDRPWFVQLWLNDVHDPWAPDEWAVDAVKGKGKNADDDRYLATLVKADRTLGDMIDRLKDMGEYDNTLIVLTSDNGPSALQRYYKGGTTPPGSVQDLGSTETLRGRKGSNYEGGIRQPLILSWPDHMKPGTRDDVTVGQGVDLMPTIAAAAGVATPSGAEGISLMPVMDGHEIPQRPTLFWAFGHPGAEMMPRGPFDPHDRAPPLAVRDGNWKLLANGDYSDVQLYNLAKDPTETTNLAPQQKAVTKRLLAKLTAWRTKFHR
jgi:arylsulfatase A-like enzyme